MKLWRRFDEHEDDEVVAAAVAVHKNVVKMTHDKKMVLKRVGPLPYLLQKKAMHRRSNAAWKA